MNKIFTPFRLILVFFLIISVSQFAEAQSCSAAFTQHQVANTLTVNFTNGSHSANTITSWSWDFGDTHTSADQNPSHTYAHDGTYTVCLTIHDDHGCTNHICHNVTVAVPAPVCHPAFTFHQAVSNPLLVEFSNTSISGGTITNWVWDFGDGHTSHDQNPSHTYTHDGTYTVCLTIDDNQGCSNHICHQVTVTTLAAPACHAGFTFHQEASPANTVIFDNTSTGTSPTTAYTWNFGDNTGSTDENPNHTYLHPGHYTVCLIITDHTTGCNAHYCHTVAVSHRNGHGHHRLVPQHSFINGRGATIQLEEEQFIISYPNPSRSYTTIHYELAENVNVQLDIVDQNGRRVRRVINQLQEEGQHEQTINVSSLNAGFYYLQMNVEDEMFQQKIIIIK